VAQFSNPKNVTPLKIEDLDKTETISKKSIHAIFAFDVLQYVEDWESLFSHFFDVIKPEGIVCVYPAAVPHPGSGDIELVTSTMEKVGFTYIKETSFQMMHNIDMVDDVVYSFIK
jgi:trans-aconitate methyltransferase